MTQQLGGPHSIAASPVEQPLLDPFCLRHNWSFVRRCYNPANMKAVILAGGLGTRLRPLTLDTPKPIVPIFDRPFLCHQIDVIRQVPEIDEVILSLSYQPDRIEAKIGNGEEVGIPVRYMVEPDPLGTGGAIKFACAGIDETILVFNGDVLTGIDLQSVVEQHHKRQARATIVLTPVSDPGAYGLVETDEQGNVRSFIEKPNPDQISCDTINAGIYVLEPETFGRIPDGVAWSIERQYFPTFIERSETFIGYIDPGYWLDIGTIDSYVQAHRDLMAQRCPGGPFSGLDPDQVYRSDGCVAQDGAELVGPCFLGSGSVIESGARVGPRSVIGSGCRVTSGAIVADTIVWRNTTIAPQAVIRDAVIGEACTIEHHVEICPGTVLGNRSVVTSYSRTRTPRGDK